MMALRWGAVVGVLCSEEGRCKTGCLDLLNVELVGRVSFRCLVLVEGKGKTCRLRVSVLFLRLRIVSGECCSSGGVVFATGSRSVWSWEVG